MSERTDVIVIGGGVVGLACANELADRGRSVLLLERDTVGCGASPGNLGMVTPSHAMPLNRPGLVRQVFGMLGKADAPVFVRLRFDLAFLAWGARFMASCRPERVLEIMRGRAALLDSSRALFDELVRREGLDCEWETHGILEVFATEEGMRAADELHHEFSCDGMKAEDYTHDQLLEHEPALRDDVAGGRHYVHDAQLRPDSLVRELERVVRAKGVEIREGCEVRGFDAGNGHVDAVVTPAERIQCGHVVVATGAWSPKLGKQLGVRIPVQPGKGYSITYSRPDPCPRQPLLLAEANMGVTPWGSGYRIGGTMELSGYDTSVNRARLDALKKGAARFLRTPEGASPEEWYGWRPMTPDELPILDRVPDLSNAVLATGHGMMGVSMAPATARIVDAMIAGEEPFVDPSPYSLARFG